MAYGNNIKGTQPRSHFQEAGGALITFSHPYLIGQLDTNLQNLDTIDVSRALKLADTYLQATPNQDSAVQEVMIDGSTVTITNRLMNGTLSLPIVAGSGLVSDQDFVAALHLIQSVGDKVGGVLTLTERIDGKALTTIYYGVTPKNVPHKIKMGMGVPTYNCTLVYAGWVQAVSESGELNQLAIWGAGNKEGIQAAYKPYAINSRNNTGDGAVNGISGVNTTVSDQTGIKGEDGTVFGADTTANIDLTKYANVAKGIKLTSPSADTPSGSNDGSPSPNPEGSGEAGDSPSEGAGA